MLVIAKGTVPKGYTVGTDSKVTGDTVGTDYKVTTYKVKSATKLKYQIPPICQSRR